MTKKMVIAVDFDGTLCEYDFPNIGRQKKEHAELLNIIIDLKNDGHKIILYTCRGDNEEHKCLSEAIEWCAERGLNFDAVNKNVPGFIKRSGPSPKPVADLYIDDRALRFADERTMNSSIVYLKNLLRKNGIK